MSNLAQRQYDPRTIQAGWGREAVDTGVARSCETPSVEDIVAVEVRTDAGSCFFLTWGRIQDRIDPSELEAVILNAASRFKMPGAPLEARLCHSLQEAAGAPFFYEYFFGFCQKFIPFGGDYDDWRKRMDERMRAGYEIASIGPFK